MKSLFLITFLYFELFIFLKTSNAQNISSSALLLQDLLSSHFSAMVTQKHTAHNEILNQHIKLHDAAIIESEKLEIFKENVAICAEINAGSSPPVDFYSSVTSCIRSKELEAEILHSDFESRTTLRFFGIGTRFISNEGNCQQRALDTNKHECFVRTKLRLTPELIRYSNIIANDGKEYENYFTALIVRLQNCFALRCEKLKTDLINLYKIPLNTCQINC